MRAKTLAFQQRVRGWAASIPLGSPSYVTIEALNDVTDITARCLQAVAAASNLRKRLQAVMAWAVGAGMSVDNPVTNAKRSKGFRTWTEEDITAYREKWAKGTPERLATEVLLHTGLRRSDAVRLGWPHLIEGMFSIVAKSQGGTGDPSSP